VPNPKGGGGTKSPIDRFILAALERRGLTPAPRARRGTLIRRLSFDLAGLPPPPEEVEAFEKDGSAEAYERLVDRLLASPHYGERWGRHWLDVARYADSDGQESDHDRPTAYHYRDFVIRALNEDLPYDTFVRWQLAGDEIEPDNLQAISATGFLTAGPHARLDVPMEEEKIRSRLDELDDILSTTGAAFLGLTVACARCHDHKYDPIPTRDYYRMSAAFNAGSRAEVPLAPWKEAVKMRAEGKKGAAPTALAAADFGAAPRETWLLERGDLYLRKERVELGFLTALTSGKPAGEYWAAAKAAGTRDDTTYQRRAMAEWITDTKDGAGALLARVIVNRVWQRHFGEGLVRSVNDFGVRGDPPTHPELLEYLATAFTSPSGSDRGMGWSLKRLHRLIVLSEAYQRSASGGSAAARVKDPENRLLWRWLPRRLESECFRDAMLAVSGTLNPRAYGPSFKPPIQTEALQARNVKDPYPRDAKDSSETRRRTVYMFHKRVIQYPLMQVFDGPDATGSCGRRNVTTVAPQALAVLNDPFVRLRAGELARRLVAEAGESPAAQVERGYRLALGRKPSASEMETSVRFLQQQTQRRAARANGDGAPGPRELALADFAQALFGLNEFIYVD